MTDEEIPDSEWPEASGTNELAPSDETLISDGVRFPWTVSEYMIGIILASAAIVVIAGLASGIMGILQDPTQVGGTQGQVTGTVLQSATTWAGIGAAVLLYLALALLWHLADSSIASINEVETGTEDDDPDEEERLRDVLRHLGRGQTLTSLTSVLLYLNVIAAGAAFAGIVVEGGRPDFDLRWEQYIMGAGVCLATIVLLVGGLNVIRHLNSRFASTDIGASGDNVDDPESIVEPHIDESDLVEIQTDSTD